MASYISGYKHKTAELRRAHKFLLPNVYTVIESLALAGKERRIFDLGCGNGSVAHLLSQKGYEVVGVDLLIEGLKQAKRAYLNLNCFRDRRMKIFRVDLDSFMYLSALKLSSTYTFLDSLTLVYIRS